MKFSRSVEYKMSNPILTKNSENKVSSPEQLNDYIKVSNLGVWLILLVLIILLASVFIWGAFGQIKTTVSAVGVAQNGTVLCYAESVDKIAVGDEVKIDGKSGKVVSVSDKPISIKEIETLYDEYTMYSLNLPEWNYEISISCENCEDGVKNAKIICDTIKPISFIIG